MYFDNVLHGLSELKKKKKKKKKGKKKKNKPKPQTPHQD